MPNAAAPIAIICAALLAAASPPAAEGRLDGVYRLDMRETASALELTADGHFQWMFSQGALDAQTEGRWRREGDKVILTSQPPRESVLCCLAHFSELPLAILPTALELEWRGEKLRYDLLSDRE